MNETRFCVVEFCQPPLERVHDLTFVLHVSIWFVAESRLLLECSFCLENHISRQAWQSRPPSCETRVWEVGASLKLDTEHGS